MNSNPFHIPDLKPMYDAIRDFIKKYQGEKGYILTDNSTKNTIWAMIFNDYEQEYREFEVKGIRVKHDRLEIVFDSPRIRYDDDSLKDIANEEWKDLRYDDYIFFLPTIFSIAESIQEYVCPGSRNRKSLTNFFKTSR